MNETETFRDVYRNRVELILRQITTFAVCLSPVLCIYRVGLFMLGEIILLTLLLVNLLVSAKSLKTTLSVKQSSIFVFAISIFIFSCVGYFVHGVEIAVFPRLVRLLFYLFTATVLGGFFFDYKYARRYIVIIALVATILIIFQKVYHDITGEFIYFISRGNIYSEVYDDFYFRNVETLSKYRPMSFFLEPSHYCQYMVFSLSIVLFDSKFSVWDIVFSLLFSAGIFVSTSSTGVIICVLLWLVYVMKMIKNSSQRGVLKARSLFIVFIIIILFGVIFIRFNDKVMYAIERIYDPASSSVTDAWNGRLGTFSIFTEDKTLSTILFGRGYGVIDESKWYASIPYYFSGTGIIGLFLITWLFLMLYLNSNSYQRKLLFIFFILCFTTEVLTNYWIVFIFSLILTFEYDKGVKA